MGIKFFPLTLGPMRLLTLRGIKLRERLQSHGLRVIESYPGAIQDILHLPRKHDGEERLKHALLRCGVRGDIRKPHITHHELDAVTLGLVALMHLTGRTVQIGDPDEALMVLPKPRGNYAYLEQASPCNRGR